METVATWAPGDYLTDQAETRPRFALVILNQPITDIEGFTRLWNNASLRVCADGGANHVYGIEIDGDIPIPDCITGDLDSLQSKVGNYYRALGVSIVPDRSLYATDFTKSLNWILKQEQLHDSPKRDTASDEEDEEDDDDVNVSVKVPKEGMYGVPWAGQPGAPSWIEHAPLDIIAYGAMGGRMDQTFHAIDQLFQASNRLNGEFIKESGEAEGEEEEEEEEIKKKDEGQNTSSSSNNTAERKLMLMSDESVTFLLEKGKNIIETPLGLFGKTCGLIPVAAASVITTKGLEWDLDETETRFGGMVSTSNHLVQDRVEVLTTEKLLFTMEMRKIK
ncbi:hypothetical protein TWF679_000495 [Orbilia oligospora]|uniref:Thiamine pyrophosphokinase n=1 Tax=Orbilia oligospora TaxID=2813651 RepID=A0A8H8UXT8_ORBOL|nr:hypothetical protein TWF679_000495 [Orbilia oligospora]